MMIGMPINGDGDLNLLVGNGDANRPLLNTDFRVVTDVLAECLPLRLGLEERLEANFIDIGSDSDLDIFFANVRLFVPVLCRKMGYF